MAQFLAYGSSGALVERLQLALVRAGAELRTDGCFGDATKRALQAFQRENGLTPDGIAGPRTAHALLPYFTGSRQHAVRPGDTLYRLARRYATTVGGIETAAPGLDPRNLPVGLQLTIPLPFPVVPDSIRVSSALSADCLRGLAARYPFLKTGTFGQSVLHRPLRYARVGTGANLVLYNASHHANEWITTLVLLRFLETLCAAAARDGTVDGKPARPLLETATLVLVPLVNPDGADLVTGALDAAQTAAAEKLAAFYPAIPFPDGWKANIRGTDLNLQYPAGWETAREIKAAEGWTRPGPRDYVGTAPLSAPESRAMARLTEALAPRLTLSYHTQGRVIYWKYGSREPAGSRAIAEQFAAESGYTAELTPYASGHAGYKDWFIQDFDRPGYTIEAGLGENPLPLSQLPVIERSNLGILTHGMTATAASV